MLEKQRQYLILQELQKHGYVKVKDMMTLLQASRSSIMRDFISMEQQGLLVREHGGASLTTVINEQSEQPTRVKETIHQYEKKLICKKASETIKEGSTIYIDAGTTTLYLIDELKNRHLTIVTPSLYFLRQIPDNFIPDIEIIGGTYHKKYDMTYGLETLEQLRNIRFDQAFFSTNSIDLKNKEVTLVNKDLAIIKAQVLKNSRESYLLADQSKLSTTSNCAWAKLNDFKEIIIDSYTEELSTPFHIINKGE